VSALNVVEAPALDQLAARRLVSEARNALAVADELLARLYAGRAWEALGHPDWPTLCERELPELRHLKMRTGPRRERVRLLADAGATVRDVAVGTGSSVGQAHADLKAVREDQVAPSADERARHVIVAELVAAAGARGLTIPQAQRRLGWSYGATSGALSRAERRGLVTRPEHLERRAGFRPYTARR
jgi:hypothetical protein